jgi:hypothetical protein
MTESRRITRSASKDQPLAAREQHLHDSLQRIVSGELNEELLQEIEECAFGLRPRSVMAVGREFPFALYFGLMASPSPGIQKAAIRTFAFFAQTGHCPVADFIGLGRSAFLLPLFAEGTKRTFTDLLRLFTAFVRDSSEFRDFLISQSIFDLLGRFPNCSRIPRFLESLFVREPSPISEAVVAAQSIFSALLERGISGIRANRDLGLGQVLNSLKRLMEMGAPLDFDFLVARIEEISESNDEEVLLNLIPIVERVSNASIALARIFMNKLGHLRMWSLLPPILRLFLSKHEVWSGFVDDELIESILILIDHAQFQEERMMVQLLCLLTGSSGDCDLRVAAAVARFVGDEQIAAGCLEVLGRFFEMELSADAKLQLAAIVDAAMTDINQVADTPGPAGDCADAFITAYSEWQGTVLA